MERKRSSSSRIRGRVNRVELLPSRGTRPISPTVHLVADLLFIPDRVTFHYISNVRIYIRLVYPNYTTWIRIFTVG